MVRSKTNLVDVAQVVVSALRDLKDPAGSSLGTIKKHIIQNFDSTPTIISSVNNVLKSGISFGLIKKSNGHYKLDNVMAIAVRPTKRAPSPAPTPRSTPRTTPRKAQQKPKKRCRRR